MIQRRRMMTCTHLAAVRARGNSGHSGRSCCLPCARRWLFSCSSTPDRHNDGQTTACVVSPIRRAELVDGIPPTKPTYRRKTTNDVHRSVSDENETGQLVEKCLAPKRRSAFTGCFPRLRARSRSCISPCVRVHTPDQKNAVPVSSGRTARRSSENLARQGRAASRVTHANNAPSPCKCLSGQGMGCVHFTRRSTD